MPSFSNISFSPLVMKVRSRGSSILSGASTPGGGTFKSLSEGDLQQADAALSQMNEANAVLTNGDVTNGI
jgi:glycogen(starch) synthase